jgi:phosphopantothenoylcysteine decarboxylase/phosphopantothenate--cysteine ligase
VRNEDDWLQMGPLTGKKIVLGVCGGIAAYKACELLRLLMKEGAWVQVVLSKNAHQFVTPLTFEALSGRPVYQEVFASQNSASMEHIRAAENADLLVIAPATAGTLGKLAHGLCEDALSNLVVAYDGPVMIAPAMNDRMHAHPAVKENMEILKSRGVRFVDAEHGPLACGTVGEGRLAAPENILQAVKNHFLKAMDLSGLKILVTAGPTREPLDPVRYLSNPSSGKMGYGIALAARDRGAQVTLISGPTRLAQPAGMAFIPCIRVEEMNARVQEKFGASDVFIMTAAVGDFAPTRVEKEKIKKKGNEPLVLKLQPTADILQEVAAQKTHQFVVGFAAETENLIESAREKLQRKKLDMIVGNDISAPGIGFQSDSNQVVIVDKTGSVEPLPLMAKKQIAHILLDRIRQAHPPRKS